MPLSQPELMAEAPIERGSDPAQAQDQAPLSATTNAASFVDSLPRDLPDDSVLVVTKRAPNLTAVQASGLQPKGDLALWANQDAQDFHVGFGAQAILHSEGSERFAAIRRLATQLWARVHNVVVAADPVDSTAVVPPAPRLFGGFAFSARDSASGLWSAFGQARFVLPQYTYCRQNGQGWLSLCVPADELADAARRSHYDQQLSSILDQLEALSKKKRCRNANRRSRRRELGHCASRVGAAPR